MKATINMAGRAVEIPAEYVDQQTCRTTIFRGVPFELIGVEALIKANGNGQVEGWFKTTDGYKIEVLTETISWDE